MNENINILIVDDTQENLKLISKNLKENGYNIALAYDGPSGLKILEENKIDLILSDIMMPDMDGFEFCQRVKDNPKTEEIPLIFLTAKTAVNDLVRGFEVGGVDYITKPFNSAEMLIRVKTHVDLAMAKNKIIEMNKTRDKLYSIIAHDIRSPFSAIRQTLEALSSGLIEPDSEDFKKIIFHLSEEASETSTLLDNLLAWTGKQGENITLVPITTNVYNILIECIQLLRGNAKNKNIDIKIDIPLDLEAFIDEVTIHTVFRNLISNAIKFTPQDGYIYINSKINDGFIEIMIKDTGVGIPKDIIETIFVNEERYTSIGTNKEKGTGLGLLMVNDFIKKNKAKIDVKSNPGEGTEIIVSLPVS
jgi:two-component system, sensor histidine kinase and response regulator